MRDTPEIRFKGFDDEWQEKKLDDLGIIISGFGFPKKEQGKKEGIPFYKISDMADPENNPIMVTASNYVGENQISRNSWDVIDLNPSIIFAKVGAAINLNRKRLALTPFLIDNNMMSFSSSSMDGNFMLTLFENIYLPKYSQVGAIPSYNDKIIGKVDVNIPDFNEQNQIGKLFARLNKLIKLKEKEIEKLEAYKNSMMKNMFPQKGEKVPKIRFERFEDEWEVKTLGDIGNTYTSLSGKNKTDFGHGKAEYVTYMNVFSNPIAKRNGTEKIEIDNNQNEVRKGDVFFTTSSETPEEVGMSSVWPYNDSNIYLNSFCFGYRFKGTIDLCFSAYLFRNPKVRDSFINLAQGISRYNISKVKSMSIKISIPSLEEQKLIGSFFYKLDKNIELKKDELEKLKEFKAALLDKMFV